MIGGPVQKRVRIVSGGPESTAVTGNSCQEMEINELKTFREVLFNKYQRRRIPWDDIVKIDAMIEEAETVSKDEH